MEGTEPQDSSTKGAAESLGRTGFPNCATGWGRGPAGLPRGKPVYAKSRQQEVQPAAGLSGFLAQKVSLGAKEEVSLLPPQQPV